MTLADRRWKEETTLMSITVINGFNNKTPISGINPQILNIFPYEVEIGLRLKVNDSYVCVQIIFNNFI